MDAQETIALAGKKKRLAVNLNEVSQASRDARRAVAHLVRVVQMIRDECAAIATCLVDPHKLDLRPLFMALRKVEEVEIERPATQPVYTRQQVQEMTGWSRVTLWRQCKRAGLKTRKKAFTSGEIAKLVSTE